jgi:nanoRNase/pAp phosphatase (c-di-AMP/oligoRNAs hydrolase)
MLSCSNYDIEELLMLPDVAERIEFYHKQNSEFKEMILHHSVVDGEIVITDLRGISPIYTGNRFLLYSLYPSQNISIWVVDGLAGQNCLFAVGYSIVNRTATADVGHIMLKYGGGGHRNVGTCQVPYENVDTVLAEIIEMLKTGNE